MPVVDIRPDFSESRIKNFSRATLINMYAERAPGAGLFPIVSDPGRTLRVQLDGPGRGQFVHLGVHYAVGGEKLYRIGSDWSATVVGALPGTYPARFGANSLQIGVLSRPNLYTLTKETEAFEQVTDPDFPGAVDFTCLNSIGVFLQVNSDRWGTTRAANFRDIDATDIATAESAADPLVGAMVIQNQLALLGTESSELWANTGSGNPPFDRAFVVDFGCISQATIQPFDGSIVWLGKTKAGGAAVMRSNGGQPVKVSNHAVDRILQAATDLSLSVGFTYVRDGHEFYELVTDAGSMRLASTTGLWTQTGEGTWPAGSEPPPSRFVNCVTVNGRTVYQDASGALYEAVEGVYLDNGQPFSRKIRTPVIAGKGGRVTINSVQLHAETGRGLDLDDEPLVSLSVSRDGGHTWTDHGTRSMGGTGDYNRKLEWRRLGQAESFTLEFGFTGNAPFHVTGAWADMTEDRRS